MEKGKPKTFKGVPAYCRNRNSWHSSIVRSFKKIEQFDVDDWMFYIDASFEDFFIYGYRAGDSEWSSTVEGNKLAFNWIKAIRGIAKRLNQIEWEKGKPVIDRHESFMLQTHIVDILSENGDNGREWFEFKSLRKALKDIFEVGIIWKYKTQPTSVDFLDIQFRLQAYSLLEDLLLSVRNVTTTYSDNYRAFQTREESSLSET